MLRRPYPRRTFVMFQSRVVFAVLAALSIPAIAHAQAQPKPATPPPAAPMVMKPGTPATPPGAPAQPSRFDEIDTNHDGFISRGEFMAVEKKRFDEFDTNHDGKIDAKEIASSAPLMERNLKPSERMVKQWDADNDGTVSAAEYQKFAEQRFKAQDKEGTGKIAKRAPMAPMMPTGKPGQTPIQPVPPAAK